MRNFLVFVLVVLLVLAAVGYWRGWFSVTSDGTNGKVGVQSNPVKFQDDKEAFKKSVVQQASALNRRVESLWQNSEKLSEDDKKELAQLKRKHDRLEQQIKNLDDVGEDRFDGLKKDLEHDLADVDYRIETLNKKLAKG